MHIYLQTEGDWHRLQGLASQQELTGCSLLLACEAVEDTDTGRDEQCQAEDQVVSPVKCPPLHVCRYQPSPWYLQQSKFTIWTLSISMYATYMMVIA